MLGTLQLMAIRCRSKLDLPICLEAILVEPSRETHANVYGSECRQSDSIGIEGDIADIDYRSPSQALLS